MIGYLHVCNTFAKFGKCRCFDDVVLAARIDFCGGAGSGGWYYWHDGVFVKGEGKAPPIGTKVRAALGEDTK